jgi:hypothetical protein
MPIPRTIVIDTNIFEQHGYNFDAEAIKKFIAIAQVKRLTILLPDAIEREVRRHIKEKSSAAQSALKKARHDAPFLQKWKDWPVPEKLKTVKDEIAAAFIADWEKFLKNFKVKRLGYEAINVNQVMDWHDQQQPPFGPGKKEKEFPDAFALAATLAYAKAKAIRIAVVSKDNDFAKFCAPHAELPYYSDLSALTEAFIDEMKTHVAGIKEVLAADASKLVALLRESFPEIVFYPEEDIDGDVEDVEVLDVEMDQMRVIAIEDEHCTIAFEANVKFSAYVSYDDPDTMVHDSSEDFHMALFKRAGTVTETACVSGTVTIEFDDEWKTILSASDLELEDRTITIEARPPIRYDDDDREEPPEEDIGPQEPQHPE